MAKKPERKLKNKKGTAMRCGTHYLLQDAEVSNTPPNCESCGQPMRYVPNETRTGISFVDRYSIFGDVHGWWACYDCVTCRSCGCTLRKGEDCDCWSCPCYAPVPGSKRAIVGTL